MEKRRIFLRLAFVAFMLISAASGFAQAGLGQDAEPSEELNLTSEQITQIRKLDTEFRKEIMPLEIKINTYDMELRSLYDSGATGSKVDAKLNQMEKIDMELENKFKAHNNRVRALLTERQKILFDRYGGLDLVLDRIDGTGYGRDYAGDYGRGYEYYGRGYGRDYGAGYGRGYGYYGRGYGRGYGMGYGRGYGYGYGLGYGRGYGANYSRGDGYARGYGPGYRCPYWRGRGGRFRDWR